MTDTKRKTENSDAEDDGAHTELRPAGRTEADGGPKPRSKRLPDELDDDPSEDDPFNDVPV